MAGEGDLLAQLERLRRRWPPRACSSRRSGWRGRRCRARSASSRGEGGKARDDVLAGLRRRGWAGRIVWAFAPVQDRHAAPAITRALQDLAACEEVEVIVVARGGGSLADLFAFCDETLCRTVALLRVPVISSVGHHTDRTLIDDVAAVACSTPTHAAEAAVPVNCGEARAALRGARGAAGAPLAAGDRRARPDARAALARARPTTSPATARALHQQLRELRASARRGARRRPSAPHRRPPRSCSSARRAPPRARERVQRGARPRAPRARARRPRAAAHARARLRARRGRRPASRSPRAAAAREHAELTLRLHDGTRVRPPAAAQ